MKIEFWCIGKTNELYLQEGIGIYNKRICRYIPYEMKILPDVKVSPKASILEIKKLESQAIIKQLLENDYLILLDEKGKTFNSIQLSEQLNKWLQMSSKRLIFLIGGAWGFDDSVREIAKVQLSLSSLTFSHQMIRLVFTEQLYRVFSILHHEPYHNE